MHTCTECGHEFTPKHRSRKVCSDTCYKARDIRRSRETYARTREQRLATWRAKSLEERKQRPPVTCGRCASTFCYIGVGAIKKFCDPCARERQRELNRGHRFTKKPAPCKHAGCDRSVNSRGMCAMHYRQWMKANGLWKPAPSDGWTDARKAQHARRKALKRGAAGAVTFKREDIFKRDGHMCMLCWCPLDMEATYPDPKSPTIDHIVPLAKGGSHTPENVQAACARCNVRKSDRLDWSLADVLTGAA
ncbi:HNH endonuclease [Agrococcus sp. DT81.2]|uniref:HNH endonuclease n=1 Tax=Agrococcus sp. DT81.2 TaxID=3393414 RepID=UPI003CE4D935